jgi:hypothetical protein
MRTRLLTKNPLFLGGRHIKRQSYIYQHEVFEAVSRVLGISYGGW